MTVLAGETALWLAFGLAVVAPFAIAVSVGVAAFFVAFEGSTGNVGEVQRFVELTEEARRLVSPELPLLDPDKEAAATAAIVNFQVKKDEARRALWASRGVHLAGREVSLSASPIR